MSEGTIYTLNTVAELERQCHSKKDFTLSPTKTSILAIKIIHLMEALQACNSLEERVDLLIKEFELDEMPVKESLSEMEMCVTVEKFDSYGLSMGVEKHLMLRAGADLNFNAIVARLKSDEHSVGFATASEVQNGSGTKFLFRSAVLIREHFTEYAITLREATEEDLK